MVERMLGGASRARFLILAGGFLLTCGYPAAADDLPAQSRTIVTKSTSVYLADTGSFKLDRRRLTYLPAGTRALMFASRTERFRNRKRNLILTETGLLAYLIDRKDQYWGLDFLKSAHGETEVAIIRRAFSSEAKISNDLTLVIRGTRGERHLVAEDLGDKIEIELDKSKSEALLPGLSLKAKLDRNAVSVIDTTAGLDRDEVSYFAKSIVDGLAGIEKACDTTQAFGIKLNQSAGFDLSKFFVTLGLTQQAEMDRTTQFGPDVSVIRTYYAQNLSEGIYKVTRIQTCADPQYVKFRIVNPDGLEITVGKDWAEASDPKLRVDRETGQVRVSCAADYFAFADRLAARDFEEAEIPFIISRTAKFRGIGRPGECG